MKINITFTFDYCWCNRENNKNVLTFVKTCFKLSIWHSQIAWSRIGFSTYSQSKMMERFAKKLGVTYKCRNNLDWWTHNFLKTARFEFITEAYRTFLLIFYLLKYFCSIEDLEGIKINAFWIRFYIRFTKIYFFAQIKCDTSFSACLLVWLSYILFSARHLVWV